MSLFLLYLIIVIGIRYSHTEINISIDQKFKSIKQERILERAITLANIHYDHRLHTAIYYNEDVESNIINYFLQFFMGSVIIETKRDSAPKQVVVIVESHHSFVKILNKLKPDIRGKTLLNSGAKFLILVLSNPKHLERITGILWNYYVTNVVIVTSNKNNTTTLHTYFPYLNHRSCQNIQPSVINYWMENTSYAEDIFSDKMTDMKGCPLYISTDKLYYQSIDQKIPLQIVKRTLVRLLRDKMNFTPIITNKDYISMDSSRAQNWSDSLNDVISGQANISTCSISLGLYRSELLDYSMPYFLVRLAWFAPPITVGPVFWRLLSPLNGYLWLLLLLVVVFVKSIPICFKIKTIKRFCRLHFKNFDKLHGVVFRIWGIMMGQPIHMSPRRFRDFYMAALWLWFTFVVRSAYQSVLIVALKTDTMVGTFNSLKEAIEYGYKFGGRASFLAYFEHDTSIRDSFVNLTDSEFDSTFWDVIEGKKKFVVATSIEYAWSYCLARGKKEEECGQILLDSIITVPLVIWMKHNSPFVRPLSVWLPRFHESGLLNREITSASSLVALKSSDPTPLTMKQFTSCVLCLFLGFSFSTAVFILEICLFRVVDYRRKKRISYCMKKRATSLSTPAGSSRRNCLKSQTLLYLKI